MKRCLRRKQEFFAIDIYKVLNEFEPNRKISIVVEGFLTNHQAISPKELLGMSCEIEVNRAIKLVPNGILVARAPYRHYSKENGKYP